MNVLIRSEDPERKGSGGVNQFFGSVGTGVTDNFFTCFFLIFTAIGVRIGGDIFYFRYFFHNWFSLNLKFFFFSAIAGIKSDYQCKNQSISCAIFQIIFPLYLARYFKK
jgi:hypothetical protein